MLQLQRMPSNEAYGSIRRSLVCVVGLMDSCEGSREIVKIGASKRGWKVTTGLHAMALV